MKKEYILAGGTIMLWGMMPPFTKLLLSGLSNAKTVFISSMIAFIFMAVLNLACGNLKRFLQYRPKDYVKMICAWIYGEISLFGSVFLRTVRAGGRRCLYH